MSFYYRFKRLMFSRWQRVRRWEFWPVWLFYIPIVIYIILLAIRYKGGSWFSIANPQMEFGGIFGDDKAATLEPLAKNNSQYLPKTIKLSANTSDLLSQFNAQNSLNYPLVLKPNIGYRGTDVAIIHNYQDVEKYFFNMAGQGIDSYKEILIQEYIVGKEFGIFYIKEPNNKAGFIFSITEKTFPFLVGDGSSTVEELILKHERAIFMAPFFIKQHHKDVTKVLDNGIKFPLVEIGSHCRGSVFLDANHLLTEELTHSIDLMMQSVPEFYFGRLDIRCPSEQLLRAGEKIKVLEINGVTSEATHIYDPSNNLFNAYRVMFRQWKWAFKIGKENSKRGYKPIPLLSIGKKFIQSFKSGT